MDIGDRIKRRREELGLSQEELAKKVGYKSRSSVNKIEIDGRGLPQNKIVLFAKALKTTPAYLMGWEDINTEDKYNMVSSTHSAEIDKFANYLFLSERNGINASNRNEYIEFIIAEKTYGLNETGKMEALKRVEELTEIPRYSSELLLNAAHARTDIDIPENTDTSEDDIMDDDNF